MANVTFDGINKLVTVNSGVSELDVAVDLYSDWKEWVVTGDNLKFLSAFRSVGGDPTVGGNSLGATYFITNGWKLDVKNIVGVMEINGNLFQDGGGNFIVVTSGVNQHTIIRTVSNLIDRVNVSGSSDVWSETQRDTVLARTPEVIADAVLDSDA